MNETHETNPRAHAEEQPLISTSTYPNPLRTFSSKMTAGIHAYLTAIGRRGGKRRTPKKAMAARRNARLAGRVRRQQAKLKAREIKRMAIQLEKDLASLV